jgi:hypothetical protein
MVLGQSAARQVQDAASKNGRPNEIAFRYLESSSALSPDDLPSVYLAQEYQTAHNGVTHLVYRQRFQGIDVDNAAWVANIAADGTLLNAGGKLFPEPGPIDFANQITAANAVRTAVREVNPRLARTYRPSELPARSGKALSGTDGGVYKVRYAAGELGGDVEGRLVWFVHRNTPLLAWVFNIVDEDGVNSFDVAIEAATGAIIEKHATTFFQSVPRGMVFDQGSPQPNPAPGVRLNSAPPVVERTLLPLAGDATASPKGWVVNSETAGYNAVVGENLLGIPLLTTAPRTRSASGNFIFPLLIGPASPNPLIYPDAANVNIFYWMNRAHDLFYAYGFDEAAGNFQSDNYGKGGTAGDAMMGFSHYGAAAPVSPSLNNAFFTARSLNDGSASMIAMFATYSGSGGFFADGAYASDVIVHEYTHGVSLRLLPNGYGSFQTAAMGEAWSDFFSLELTLPEALPLNGSYPVGEYWIQSWGTGIRTRPFSTDTGVNPITYSDLGHIIFPGPEIHADGEIWVEALWDARANLIQQFGEKEGRRRIRQLIVDGLKLCVPSPTMVDARDAILLADRVDFAGVGQDPLWRAFAKRGLGAFAHSDGGDTIHVISSFELPSPTGRLKMYENTFVAGEPIRVLLSDSNLTTPTVMVQITTSSGDVEDLTLRSYGSIAYGIMPSSTASVTRQNGIINITPGDVITATYVDADPGFYFFIGPGPARATAATQQPYAAFTGPTTSGGLPPFSNETRLTGSPAPVSVVLPFDFPFFSKKYRSMTVDPLGAIWFEPSVFTNLFRTGCKDTTELRRLAAIAPLFASLTFGTAQDNEGMFISFPAPDTVAIRWAAETLPAPTSVPPGIPEPVNFAATLTSAGVITFYYGSGNQNLHTATPTLSTCGGQPAAGLSNGHDAYMWPLVLRTYNNAPFISFYPPFNSTTTPQVVLERPAPAETVRGVMRVTGYAYDPGIANVTIVSRRDIFIDGVQRAIAPIVARLDVCTANPLPGCPNVGFQSELNLAAMDLAPGPHTMFVRITNTRGAFADSATVSFTVDGAPARLPKGAIEAPASGAEISGTVQFRGYAYADDLRITRVDLLIDNLNYPAMLYGLGRSDICGTLPAPVPPNCPAVGWSLSLNTRTGVPPLTDGPHSMQLRVLDQTGRYTLIPDQPIPFSVQNGPQPFPVGAITSIKPNDELSGVVPISGYAYSPAGRISSVILLIDGSSYALAQYGLPRPDDCSKLSGVTACPNIGFNANLDTRILTNGHHVIGVRITNDAGLGVTVPDQVRTGMNVTIANQ